MKSNLSHCDSLDKAILELLNQDARLPSTQIARRLGVANRTVHNRIQRMLEDKIIQPVCIAKPAAFGYTLAVDILCEIEIGFVDQAIDAILRMPEISYAAISTGDQDLSLQAVFRNSEEMHDFISHRLHQVPGMRRTRTVLLPRIIKDSYQWLPPEESFNKTTSVPS